MSFSQNKPIPRTENRYDARALFVYLDALCGGLTDNNEWESLRINGNNVSHPDNTTICVPASAVQ